MSKLYAVAKTEKSPKQEAREAVKRYRKPKPRVPIGGMIKGERFNHRGWPAGIYEAFLSAPVIKPAIGEIQRKLYGMGRRV